MSVNLVETFANALLELSLERKDVESFLSSSLVVKEILEENRQLERILTSHMVADSDKHKVIEEVFTPLVNHYYANFMHVVVDKNDFSIFGEINDEFIKLATHSINAKDAYVYSVKPVSKVDLDKIKHFLEDKYKLRVFMHNPIDKSLVGGLRVVMEDITFDNSVSFQLKQLKERILMGTR